MPVQFRPLCPSSNQTMPQTKKQQHFQSLWIDAYTPSSTVNLHSSVLRGGCPLTPVSASVTLSAMQLAPAARGEGPTLETGFAGAGAVGIRDIHINAIQMEGWMDWWPGRESLSHPLTQSYSITFFALPNSHIHSGLSAIIQPCFLLIRKPIPSDLKMAKTWVFNLLRFYFLIWLSCVPHLWFN